MCFFGKDLQIIPILTPLLALWILVVVGPLMSFMASRNLRQFLKEEGLTSGIELVSGLMKDRVLKVSLIATSFAILSAVLNIPILASSVPLSLLISAAFLSLCTWLVLLNFEPGFLSTTNIRGSYPLTWATLITLLEVTVNIIIVIIVVILMPDCVN